MIKQRMLSAMGVIIALNIITQNCTTQQTMLVSAKPNHTKMYTTTNVNVRVKPSAKSKKVKTLKPNTRVVVVKKLKNGWTKIKLKGKYRYLCSKYLSKKKTSNRWNITLSNNEIDLLSRIVYHEARGESDIGQQAVVETIFNRIKSSKYPDSLYGVVSQSGQFASYKLINRSMKQSQFNNCKKNVKKVLKGKTNILPKSYLYFSIGGHSNHEGVIRIGNHQFCKTY